MPDATSPVVSPPQKDWNSYDPTLPDGSDVCGWKKLDSGPADAQGMSSGDWPDGPGPWKQT